jgi:hypothetical protein
LALVDIVAGSAHSPIRDGQNVSENRSSADHWSAGA